MNNQASIDGLYQLPTPPALPEIGSKLTLLSWATAEDENGWPLITDDEDESFVFAKVKKHIREPQYLIAVNDQLQLANPLGDDKTTSPEHFVEVSARVFRLYIMFLKTSNMGIYECACRTRGMLRTRPNKLSEYEYE
jgi:hypothetical protein